MFLGTSGVGKSCLARRLVDGVFSDSTFATVGVDFVFRTIDIDGKRIKVQLWDYAGLDQFQTAINRSLYRQVGAFVVMLCDRLD